MNNGFIKAGVDLNDNITLTTDGGISKFKTYDPGPITKPRSDNWLDIIRQHAGFSIENKWSDVQGALKLLYSHGRHSIYDGFSSHDNALAILFYQSVKPIPENILTLGIDYKTYGGEAENTISAIDYGTHSVREFGLYLHTQQFLLGRIALNGGVRYEHSSVFGKEIIPQIGAAVRITDETTIKASAAKGFRSPTIRELYLFPAPTPTLKPERLWNYEAGILQSFGEEVNLELVGFIARGSNLIRTEGVYPNLLLSNSGDFTHRGVEFAAHYTPIQGLSLNASYSYLDPQNETRGNPRHKTYFGINFDHGIFVIDIGLLNIIRVYGDDFSRKGLPDYTLLNATVTFSPIEALRLSITSENLFNTSYQMMADYPMPGRMIFARVGFMY